MVGKKCDTAMTRRNEVNQIRHTKTLFSPIYLVSWHHFDLQTNKFERNQLLNI